MALPLPRDSQPNLMRLVESQMQSSLTLENHWRPVKKVNFPNALMSLLSYGSPMHFFQVPADNDELSQGYMDRPKFGVVTGKGTVLVYDTMFRRILWRQFTNINKVSWGTLSMNPTQDLDAKSTLLIHSKADGLHLVKKDADHLRHLVLKSHTALSYENHSAFCKPLMCSDGDVLLPVGMNKLGLLTDQDKVTTIYTFPSMIMSIKEVSKEESSKKIICTTEDGNVVLLSVKVDLEKKEIKASHHSTLLLPTYPDVEQQPIGTCVEGYGDTFVIGTSCKYMFLIKVAKQEDNSFKLEPSGKKVLPTEGVSCMAMRDERGLLAAGCYDGTIRLFSFPDMNRISTINYHHTQIAAMIFINETKDKTGRWFLLTSSTEPVVCVWIVGSIQIQSPLHNAHVGANYY